jgi:16S rRNA (cytosine967-C5)-methyltransferase
LRDALRGPLKLGPDAAARLSRLVFGFFRWRGWLDEQAPLPDQVREADALARRFAEAPETFTDAELAGHAVPGWVRDFMEVTPAWARALQTEPPLWLRAKPGQGRALAAKLGDCEMAGDGPLADALRYRGTTDLFRTPEFQAGEFEIQDLHSQAVGWICEPRSSETWWDACAGEGGKTLHLSALMAGKGLIWASDLAAWRLRRLKLRAARAGAFNYRAAAWDGGERLPTRTKFDGVLVDAPCGNLGTWGRNPHARWTTTPGDVRELAALQERLLAHAAGAVKAGGRLVFAVCTLTRAETSELAERFSARHGGFAPVPFANTFQPAAPPAPMLLLRSEATGGNGMFIAVWRRNS